MMDARKEQYLLIVDDQPAICELLNEAFASEGYQIETASNSDQAIRAIRARVPKLIFMDINMPGKNGLEVTQKIKEVNSDVEVVILTSYDIPEYRAAALRSGASHFFIKGNSGSDEIATFVRCSFQKRGKDVCAGFEVPEVM